MIIKNLWGIIDPYCPHRHETPIKMELKQGESLFYACPHYYAENRDEHDRACVNRLNLVDFEKFVDHISKIIYDAQMNNEVAVLTNHVWKHKSVEFKITTHKQDQIIVEVLNKKSLK